MRYRILSIVPLLLALLLLGLDLLPLGPEADLVLHWVNRWLARSLAIFGCSAALLTFRSGEYLWRAWLFIGICHVLLVVRDITPALDLQPMLVTTEVPGVLANLFYIFGLWTLAWAWRVAEIQLPVSKRRQYLVGAVAIIVAIGFVGPTMFIGVRDLMQGHFDRLTWIAAGIADSLGFFLVTQLLLTALALRGGLLAWPWVFYTISQFFWLVLVVVSLGSSMFGLDEGLVELASDFVRLLASGFLFSAGMAQRFVMKQMARADRLTARTND